MTNALTPTTEPAAGTLAPAGQASIADLLRFAVSEKVPVEHLERLLALQERVMDRNAAAEFFDAMAQFQRQCPPIRKSSTASFATKSGAKASYTYAELDEIARTVNPILALVGLSYSWDSTVTDAGVMVCTCTLRHRSGHSRTAQFGSKIEGSSLMSGHQATAATLTYARRQSLVQVLGLTSTDDDRDGAGPPGGAPNDAGDKVTEAQGIELVERTESLGNKTEFCAYFGIATPYDLPASRIEEARAGLAKRESRRGK